MKKITVGLLALMVMLPQPTLARSAPVRGHVTKSGTYKPPHYRTTPNRSKLDNWSTKGNVNPYTGIKGSKKPY